MNEKKKVLFVVFQPWAEAVAAAQRNDLAPLIKLLREPRLQLKLPPQPPDEKGWRLLQEQLQQWIDTDHAGHELLADLLSRSTGLKKKRGAQPVPLLQPSSEDRHDSADELVFNLMAPREFYELVTKKSKAATVRGLSREQLKEFIKASMQRSRTIPNKGEEFEVIIRQRPGLSKPAAIAKAAPLRGLTREQLTKSIKGRRPGFGKRPQKKNTDSNPA